MNVPIQEQIYNKQGLMSQAWIAFFTRLARWNTVQKGTTAKRPKLGADDAGMMYFDTTLAANGKPIWWNGALWTDSAGTAV